MSRDSTGRKPNNSTRSRSPCHFKASPELTGEPSNKLDARRTPTDRVQIVTVSVVFDMQFEVVVHPCQTDAYRVFGPIVNSMFHRIGQQLIQYQGERHRRL